MNKSLRLWIQLVATLGLLVILQSLVSLYTTPQRYEWLFFAALAILTGSFSMKIGSVYAPASRSPIRSSSPRRCCSGRRRRRSRSRSAPPSPRGAAATIARRVAFNTATTRSDLGGQPLLPAGGRAAAGADAGAADRGPADPPAAGAHRRLLPDQLGPDRGGHRPRCAPVADRRLARALSLAVGELFRRGVRLVLPRAADVSGEPSARRLSCCRCSSCCT